MHTFPIEPRARSPLREFVDQKKPDSLNDQDSFSSTSVTPRRTKTRPRCYVGWDYNSRQRSYTVDDLALRDGRAFQPLSPLDHSQTQERRDGPKSPRISCPREDGTKVELCPNTFTEVIPGKHPSDCCETWEPAGEHFKSSPPLLSVNDRQVQASAKRQVDQSQGGHKTTPEARPDTGIIDQFLNEVKKQPVQQKDDKPSQLPQPSKDLPAQEHSKQPNTPAQKDSKVTPAPEIKMNSTSPGPPPHPAKDDPNEHVQRDQSAPQDKCGDSPEQPPKQDQSVPAPKDTKEKDATSAAALASDEKGVVKTASAIGSTKREIPPKKVILRTRPVIQSTRHPGLGYSTDKNGRARRGYLVRKRTKTKEVLEIGWKVHRIPKLD